MLALRINNTGVSGNTVGSGMFATNFLTRSHDASPDGNFAQALTLVHATGLRFPGGSMTEESFDVTDPNRAIDDQGRRLTPLSEALSFAQATGNEMTIVIPTRDLLGIARDSQGNRFIDPAQVAEVRTFVQNTLEGLQQTGNAIDIIKAFELGNEYWGSGQMTSTEYGRVVTALAPMIANVVLHVLGRSAVGQIGILAQMGGAWGREFDSDGLYGSLSPSSDPALLASLGLTASDFGANGNLTWGAKVELANMDIIEQIGPAARDALTGLVEHFYLHTEANDLTYGSDTLRQINVDNQIWGDAGFGNMDLVITEWNIEADNQAQFGLKGAGALLFQFESMIQMGVDEAFSWPLLHSGTTDLAGGLRGEPYLTPAGAALQHMAANLEGLQLLDVTDTTPGLEIAAYGSNQRTVLYLSSREVQRMQVDADVSAVVNGSVLTSAEMIGVDMATSDGRHVLANGTTVTVPYYAEHDVRAQIRYLDEAQTFGANTIHASIGAYEVLMLTFERVQFFSAVSYTLDSSGISLVLTGSAAINGAGNARANLLTGNDAANHLYGGLGNDTLVGNGGDDTLFGQGGSDRLIGGLGNDTYIVDQFDSISESATSGTGMDTPSCGKGHDTYRSNGWDTIIERPGEGIDLVVATVTHTLGANIENLTLGGTSNLVGIGNVLDNVLTGNSGNNVLDGGTGMDTLVGGQGNDTYRSNGWDTIIERPGEGIDHVIATVTHTLGADIENLTLVGTSSFAGVGNSLANVIVGNIAANNLDGNQGNDTLDGSLGQDTLIGGAGTDSFVFDSTLGGTNIDTISDFNVVEDMIRLDDAIFGALTAGGLAASNFVANMSGTATSASNRIIYEADTGALSYDADGSGSGAAMSFAYLQPSLALSNLNFLVI